MVICPSCGGENADDALFCGFCGAKLQSGQKKTLFGVAAIPKGDLEKAAKQAREATEKAKAEKAAADSDKPQAKQTPKESASSPDSSASSSPAAAEAPKPAAAEKKADKETAPKAKETPEKKKRDPISLSTPAVAKQQTDTEEPSEDSEDDGWSLDGLDLSSDTSPTVPDVEEEEPKAGLDTVDEVDSETGPTLVDAEAGPTVQMEAVPPLKKESLEAPAAQPAAKSTVPSAAPVEKKNDDDVTTLEDEGPPGADGTVAKGIGAETTLDAPAEGPTRAGEASLKSAPKVQPVESGPNVKVRESAVSEAAARKGKPSAKPSSLPNKQAAQSQPSSSPTTGDYPAPVNPTAKDYPAPVKPGSKEDEEAFFGASLSQYGMAPVQQRKTPQSAGDSDLKPSGGVNWGLVIFGFIVIGAIIGAIAFLLSVGAE